MEEIGFDPGWLNERFPFDADARNEQVEKQCIQYLDSKTQPVIVDLGAGNGANCKYFLTKFFDDHTWIFVEKDKVLIEEGKANILEFAKDQGARVEVTTNELILNYPHHKVKIKMVCGSLLEVDELLDLTKIDLVMSNAVFDLFPKYLFASLAYKFARHQLPFLATLNYNNMLFFPEKEHDQKLVSLYEAHMQRSKPEGAGMGKTCSREMYEVLEDLHADITIGLSTWKIKETNQKMLQYLYNYMDTSLHEMEMSVEEEKILNNWLIEKQEMIKSHQLKLEVGHYDIFAQF